MKFFITGTDTGIGKTHVTVGLLRALSLRGYRVAGMKPIAAGTDGAGKNEDVERLQAASAPDLPTSWLNPCLLPAPTAPHIAAARAGRQIEWRVLDAAWKCLSGNVHGVLVEGVGGWEIPLSEDLMLADLPRRWSLPVVLVVGVRLGALNHGLLTADAIERAGCRLAGWIANRVDPTYAYAGETIDALRARIAAPCLADLPWQTGGDTTASAGLTVAASALEHWPRTLS